MFFFGNAFRVAYLGFFLDFFQILIVVFLIAVDNVVDIWRLVIDQLTNQLNAFQVEYFRKLMFILKVDFEQLVKISLLILRLNESHFSSYCEQSDRKEQYFLDNTFLRYFVDQFIIVVQILWQYRIHMHDFANIEIFNPTFNVS